MPSIAATSPIAYTSGSEVWQLRSVMMPPRSPTSMPHSRASWSRGRTPAAKMMRSVSKLTPSRLVSIRRRPSTSSIFEPPVAQSTLDAELLDVLLEDPAAGLVELAGHEPGRELDDLRLEAQERQRVRGFEAEQAAADDDAVAPAAGVGLDRLEVLDGAVDEHAFEVRALHRGHERVGAGGEHELVVRVLAGVGVDHLAGRGRSTRPARRAAPRRRARSEASESSSALTPSKNADRRTRS